MKVILIGYGNVGKEVEIGLKNKTIPIHSIIHRDQKLRSNILSPDTFLFICVPSKNRGEEIAHYYLEALNAGSKIITCEKAFIAHNWKKIQEYKNNIRYSATVGGNSGILNAISEYPHGVKEIEAVVNGTLNYIGEALLKGSSEEKILKDVVQKGYAGPGAKDFEEVIEMELNDMLYKTAILTNHSGLYKKIIEPKAISLDPYKKEFRASVLVSKNQIRVGFFGNLNKNEFPSGVNNILYTNGKKMAEGPGAGGKITAERMFKDFQELLS